jgi:hypothetical protein
MSQPQFEMLLAWASKDRDDIIAARREYFAATGEVFEDDSCFESRMQGFFNWYLFDRPYGTPPLTFAQRYLLEEGAHLSGVDKAVFLGFTKSRHSLYEIKRVGVGLIKVREDQVKVKDAFSGEEFLVTERRKLPGLEKGDLLEARLMPVNDAMHFSTAFTWHPKPIHPLIWKEIKRRKKAGTLEPRNFCWELSRMALNLERFKNISPSVIYSFEQPFLAGRHRREDNGG